MSDAKHYLTGVLSEATGNPNQLEGKHVYGVRLIPLGDRNRERYEFGINVVQERDSDANIWRI